MKITKAMVEAAAAAIGLEVGLEDGSKWTLEYAPKVRWPHDYSERERARLRMAAVSALDAAASVSDEK